MRSHQSYHNITTVIHKLRVLYNHRIHGKLGLQLSFRWVFKEKSKQMFPVMGEKQMSKRLGGIKDYFQVVYM